MPTATMEDAPKWRIPKETPLPATLVAVKEAVIPYKNKTTGADDTFTKWEWEFEVTAGEFQGIKVWGKTEDRLSNHPNNLVRPWAESIRGRPFELGEGLDTNDLIGLPCVVEVDHTSYDRNGETRYLTPVLNVYPADAFVASEEAAPF